MNEKDNEFIKYIKENYYLGDYGVVHEKEIPIFGEQFGLDDKKVKQELKRIDCIIFKSGSKINAKNVEWDKLKDIKLGKGQRIPKYVQGKKIETAAGKRIWSRIREELLREHNMSCQICGFNTDKPGDLHAHEIWEYDENNFVLILKEIQLICTRCHGCQHPENAAMLSIKNDEKKGILRVIPKSHVLEMYLMRVNQWNLDTFKQYQKKFSDEKCELMRAEVLNARSSDPAAVKKRELNNANWRYNIEGKIPFHDEVIQILREKDLYFD